MSASPGPTPDPDRLLDLLPPRVVEVASAWHDRAADLLGRPRPGPDGGSDLHRSLVLPLVVEPHWPGPGGPVAVRGGWVQADLHDDDRDTFARLRSARPDADAEELAAAAQELRLPVLPYRAQRWAPAETPPAEAATPRFEGQLTGVRVLDLTSLWAGPFATRLLADAGATVTKVDPDCRPDGFRLRPHLYDELNAGKEIVDLDLRDRVHRTRFEGLLASADLLVHSLSRRVLPNFGYDHATLREHNPRLAVLAVAGFPDGCPERDWLAFGTGIHAVSGLGMVEGRARTTPVAYPDALTGYAAFSRAIEIVGAPTSAEVTLIGTTAAVAATA